MAVKRVWGALILSSLQDFLFLLLDLFGEAFQILNAMLIFEVLLKEQEHIVAHAQNAKGVSPRILTKLACMEEPDGLIW